MSSAVQAAFDALAPAYDAEFTESVIGRLQRAAVRRRLEKQFKPDAHILDIGCGTGADAVWLVRLGMSVHAVDLSPAMVAQTELRIREEGLAGRVTVEPLAAEDLDQLIAPDVQFDGVLSNFGALNCVGDLGAVARSLARLTVPGASLCLCLMSRFCLWETLFYPLTLQIHKGLRRRGGEWAPASVGESEFRVYYPSVARVAGAFDESFRLVDSPGIGLFVPPTYLEPWAARHRPLLKRLAGWDARLAHRRGWRGMCDHRLLIFKRIAD